MSLSFDEIIKTIEQLPAPEQERIRRWLDENVTPNGERNASQPRANRSAKSLRWLLENRKKYSGQWVALDGDSLIAGGPTAKEFTLKRRLKALRYRSSNWS